MRVTRIYYKNILGLEELDLRPKALTRITGRNGAGKTSAVTALLSLVKGGHDATLLRNGAQSGEIVIDFDDGESFRQPINAERSQLELRNADNKKVAKPKEHLEQLIDALSVNPIAFLTAPAKEKAQKLLEVLPLKVSAEEMKAIGIDPDVLGIPKELFGRHGLDVLAQIHDHIYDTRQGINRDANQKRSTEKQLRDALGEEKPDVGGDLAEKRQALAAIDSGLEGKKHEIGRLLEQRKAEIRDEFSTKRQAAEAECQTDLRKVDAEIAALEAKIAGLRGERSGIASQLRSALTAIEVEEKAAFEMARVEANDAYGHYRAQQHSGREGLVREISVLEEQQAEQIRVQESRRMMEEMRLGAEELEARSKGLTALLKALESYREKKLLDLPIKGLTVEKGEIYLDSSDGNGPVHIEKLNWAKQVQLSLRLAKLRAGKCGFVAIDNIERLDDEMYEAFEKAAVNSGLQFLITQVAMICTCGHDRAAHEAGCLISGCRCEAFQDRGLTIEYKDREEATK